MNETWLDAYNKVDGITLRIKCRDDIFDYVKNRKILTEQICIELVNEIKKIQQKSGSNLRKLSNRTTAGFFIE